MRLGARLALLVGVVFVSPPVLADQEHGGTLSMFHLNGVGFLAGRGTCLQMIPAVPGTGWACLWKTNPLYKEITTLLLTGYATGRSCKIGWAGPGPDGHPQIVWAECY